MAKDMEAFLKERSKKAVVLCVKQIAKPRLKLASLITKDVDVASLLHYQQPLDWNCFLSNLPAGSSSNGMPAPLFTE